MSARADLPAGGVHFRTSVAQGFGVARGDEGRKGAPGFGCAEKLAVFEIARLADTVEDEANVVAAVAPDFVQPPQRGAGGLAEAHFGPDGDMRDRVARAVSFAENVGVAVGGDWVSCVNQARGARDVAVT